MLMEWCPRKPGYIYLHPQMSTEECQSVSVNAVTSQTPFKSIHLQDTNVIAEKFCMALQFPLIPGSTLWGAYWGDTQQYCQQFKLNCGGWRGEADPQGCRSATLSQQLWEGTARDIYLGGGITSMLGRTWGGKRAVCTYFCHGMQALTFSYDSKRKSRSSGSAGSPAV